MAATLVLRTVKGTPLTNIEVDNNFSNLNTFGDVVSSNIGILTNLTTTSKGNIVVAINELVTGNSTQNTRITLNTTNLTTTNANIGVLSGLITSNTGNLVSAVNEVQNEIGVLTGLVTTAKANLVAAINEVALEATTNVAITGGSVSNVTLSFIASDDTSTNSTFYPTLLAASSGNAAVRISSSKLFFNPSTGLLTSTDYNSSSDITLKEDITDIDSALDTIKQLQGKSFTWKAGGAKGYGLIAQEVEKIIPDIVTTNDGIKGINYINSNQAEF